METLVLLPGLDGTGRLFGPFVAALPAGWTARIVAYPGDRRLDPEGLLDCVVAECPADRPYVIVAESFSGPVVLGLAAGRPTGLAGIVLVASFVTSPMSRLMRMLVRCAANMATRMPMPRGLVADILAGGDRSLADQIGEIVGGVEPAVIAARMRVLATVDARAHLTSCTVPLFWLAARDDRLVPRSQTELFRTLRPDDRVRVVAAPHLVLQTRPELAVAEIVEFVGSLSNATSIG